MKVFLQSEASECGLASLSMVADHHGHHVGLRELRRRFPLSLKGASLKQLIAIADHLGFQSRPLRAELEQLDQLQTPCILHWNLNHFVVLAKAGANKITIHDPAIGKRVLKYAEASEHFTGIALELTPTAKFEPAKELPAVSIAQLTGPTRGIWSALSLVFMLSVALQVFAIVSPFYMQWIVDQVLLSADHDLLTVLGLGFSAMLLVQTAIGFLRGSAVVYLSNRIGVQWMGNVFSHLLKLPLEFFEKRHLGDVVSRMNGVNTIQHTLTTSFVEAFIDGMMALVTLGMMLMYSPKLACVTLLAVAAYLGLRAAAVAPMKDATETHLTASSSRHSHLLESIRGIQSIKVSGREQLRQTGYANLLNNAVNSEVWLAKLDLGFASVSQLIFGLERIVVIWFGAALALHNVFSVGMLIAYLSYKEQFAGRVSNLIDKWVEFRMLRLHGERLAEIVLTPPETDSAERCDVEAPSDTRIEVCGVSFRYAEGEPWVLRDCNFTIADGESVAIVGPSGCGKTTLAKLMLGLLQPTEGTIKVGGQDIRKLGVHNYRAIIGAVMQDDQLFAGSLMENIAFSEEGFEPADVEAAAHLAAVHDDIMAMQMGYHSLIGDMGTTLSGGQKQRVILARALYRKPRILFLDEATSALDVERERTVNDAVRRLKLTKIIIAHRPETIASADRVLTMESGRIAKESRPQTLHLVPMSAATSSAGTAA